MVQLHFERQAVTCKIVYYGPGQSGKTTNLQVIHDKAPENARGDLVSIATKGDRTLYFDFMPLDLGQVSGMQTTFQLYTVPGQIYYNNTRKLVLQGVDGVVFVADSSPGRMQDNQESLNNLMENLAAIGRSIHEIPLVIQYNKRDIPGALPIAELDAHLNPRHLPTFEAVASEGQGVFVTLKEIGRLVIERINQQTSSSISRRRSSFANGQADQKAAKTAGTTPLSPATEPKLQSARTTPLPHPMVAPIATPIAGTPPPAATPLTPKAGHTPAPQRTTTTSGRPNDPTRMMRGPDHEDATPTHGSVRRQAPPPPEDLDTDDEPAPAAAAQQAPGAGRATRTAMPGKGIPASPKDRHLQKARPPALAKRAQAGGEDDAFNLGPTDPHLKRFRAGDDGEAPPPRRSLVIRLLVVILLTLVIALIIAAVLLVVWPAFNAAVMPFLPPRIQDLLRYDVPVASGLLIP